MAGVRQRPDIRAIKRRAAVRQVHEVMDVLTRLNTPLILAVLAQGALAQHGGAEAEPARGVIDAVVARGVPTPRMHRAGLGVPAMGTGSGQGRRHQRGSTVFKAFHSSSKVSKRACN